MLIAKIFGVTGTAGLTLALCRRARTVFWAGVGAMCMIVIKKADGTSTIAESRIRPTAVSRRIGSANTPMHGTNIFDSTQA